MINQSEILSRSQVQFITLSFGGAQLRFTSHGKLHEFLVHKNQFLELNRHIMTFSQ
jgi:hypothetical protein